MKGAKLNTQEIEGTILDLINLKQEEFYNER